MIPLLAVSGPLANIVFPCSVFIFIESDIDFFSGLGEPDSCNLSGHCLDGEIVGNPNDCSTYMLCTDGQWAAFQCHTQMPYFDSIMKQCVDADPICTRCPADRQLTIPMTTPEFTGEYHWLMSNASSF